MGEGLGEGYFRTNAIMNKISDTNQANSILSDTPTGIYIYCLARTPVSFPHTMIGIDGIHGVYLAEQDGIFSVISDVSLKEYNEEALEKNMIDVAWLVPRAKRHEEVIEFVMTHATLNQHVNPDSTLSPHLASPLPLSPTVGQASSPDIMMTSGDACPTNERDRGRNRFSPPLVGGVRACPVPDTGGGSELLPKKDTSTGQHTPVVPLRFCTIYKSQESLFNAIIPHREKILNFLDYTVDKTEWSVKVFCDKTIFMNNCDKDKEQSTMDNQSSLSPGEAYLLAKKMRKIKEENFKQGLQMYLKDIDFTLSQFADSYRFLQCTDKSIHGRPLDMVMNTAFLVEQQTFNMFKDTLDMLAEKYRNEGLAFEFSGPWPPYNFCPAL